MSNLLILFSFFVSLQNGGPLPSRLPTPQGPGLFSRMPACTVKLGSWVQYRVVNRKRAATYTMKLALVGRSADGKSTWIEMELAYGTTSFKIKMLTEGNPRRSGKVTKVIIQIGNMAPVSLPPDEQKNLMPLITRRPVKKMRLVAEEKVTTPAGTFTARRYEGLDEDGNPVKLWFSQDVKIWRLLKFHSSVMDMELLGQGTGARSRLPDTAPMMKLR